MSEKPEKLAETGEIRDASGKFVEGHPPMGGRPQGSFSLVAILKEELQKVPEGRQRSYAHELITAMLHKGIIEKDSPTQKLIMNYVEGLPKGSLDLTTKGEAIQTTTITAELLAIAEEELKRRKLAKPDDDQR